MRYVCATAALALAACLSFGGEIVGEKDVAPYTIVRLRSDVQPAADKDGKVTTRYTWSVEGKDSGGKPLAPDVERCGHTLRFVGPPGRYTVKLTVLDFKKELFEQDECVVTIREAGPQPKPPEPGPTPEEPDDPLFTKLKAAYALDAGRSKSGYANQLAGLYAAVAKKLDGWKTAGEMDADIKSARRDMGVGEDDLRGVREVIGAEMKRFMPDGAAAELTAEHKSRCKALFERLAKYLDLLAQGKTTRRK